MLDIRGSATDPLVARLSNFTDRTFSFRSVQCAGLEGILQSLKCSDFKIQKEICALRGREAKRFGNNYNNWKDTQMLWWNERSFNRAGREYFDLITSIYDAVYDQDVTFRNDLLAVGHEDICHSIGNPDMRDTVLTEVEMIHQLNRLRIRVFRDHR